MRTFIGIVTHCFDINTELEYKMQSVSTSHLMREFCVLINNWYRS